MDNKPHPVCKKGCWAGEMMTRIDALKKERDTLIKERDAAEDTIRQILQTFMKPSLPLDHWKIEKVFPRLFGKDLKK